MWRILSSVSKFWCRSSELSVYGGQARKMNIKQRRASWNMKERLTFLWHFSLVIPVFTPVARLCLWKLLLRLPSMIRCSYGVQMFCKIPCVRHFVNDQIFAVYWCKLKPQNDLCCWICYIAQKKWEKPFVWNWYGLSVDEIFDCLIDQQYSNHLYIFLVWCSVEAWSARRLFMTSNRYIQNKKVISNIRCWKYVCEVTVMFAGFLGVLIRL